MSKKMEKAYHKRFEEIKHTDETGIEFWYARELQHVLDYKEWRKFENVINKAKQSCNNSGISAFEHFVEADKTIKMPKGAQKKISDYKLTRYACYLIAQNGDSRKEVIALAQTYFAIQTRKQEISEKEYYELTEDEKEILTDACKALVIKGNDVHLVRGETFNMKITTQYDLKVANGLVEGQTI